MIIGERIYLRLMEEKDVIYKVGWINDPDVRKSLNFDYPISEVGTKQWLYRVASDNSRKDFIVCMRENDLPIGYCGFLNIDIKNSKAESYMGIGDKKHWGKGLGNEIRELLLEYGFNELSLNKIYSYVWADNEKMLELNKKFGFIVEGLLRQDIFSHGNRRDRYIMGILKKEYNEFKNS